MADLLKVKSSFFEDDSKNIFFWYTGKENVLGLHQPDFIYSNDDKFKYARVAYYPFIDTGDTVTNIHIDETITVNTLPSSGSDDISNSQCVQVHVQSIARGGRVVPSTTRCSIVDYNSNVADKKAPEIIITEDDYVERGIVKYGLGIWINIDKAQSVLTKIDRSLSATYASISSEHFEAYYIAQFLTNENGELDKNLVNVIDYLNPKTIVKGSISTQNIGDRIDALEKKTANEPHQFVQNTAVYSPVYIPKKANTEDKVPIANIIGPTSERIIKIDTINTCITVLKNGIYAIQFKNGFYLDEGETRLDLKVFKNNDEIKEMKISTFLTSNPDDKGKVVKNFSSSNVYVAKLTTSDKISLFANWGNIDGLSVENESMLTVTALQYNLG